MVVKYSYILLKRLDLYGDTITEMCVRSLDEYNIFAFLWLLYDNKEIPACKGMNYC